MSRLELESGEGGDARDITVLVGVTEGLID